MARDSSATVAQRKSIKSESKRHQNAPQRRLLTPADAKTRICLPVARRLILGAGVPRAGPAAVEMFRDRVINTAFKEAVMAAHTAAVSRGAQTMKRKDVSRGLLMMGKGRMFTAHLKKRSSRAHVATSTEKPSEPKDAEPVEPKRKTGPKSAKVDA